MFHLTQMQARRIVARFPWPKTLGRPGVALSYLGLHTDGMPIYQCVFTSGRIHISLRHPTAEGALRMAISTLLAEHERLAAVTTSATAARELARLAN